MLRMNTPIPVKYIREVFKSSKSERVAVLDFDSGEEEFFIGLTILNQYALALPIQASVTLSWCATPILLNDGVETNLGIKASTRWIEVNTPGTDRVLELTHTYKTSSGVARFRENSQLPTFSYKVPSIKSFMKKQGVWSLTDEVKAEYQVLRKLLQDEADQKFEKAKKIIKVLE